MLLQTWKRYMVCEWWQRMCLVRHYAAVLCVRWVRSSLSVRRLSSLVRRCRWSQRRRFLWQLLSMVWLPVVLTTLHLWLVLSTLQSNHRCLLPRRLRRYIHLCCLHSLWCLRVVWRSLRSTWSMRRHFAGAVDVFDIWCSCHCFLSDTRRNWNESVID